MKNKKMLSFFLLFAALCMIAMPIVQRGKEIKADPLQDGRRLEANNRRMSIEYKINRGNIMNPIVFTYSNGNFYLHGFSFMKIKWLNFTNRHIRYYDHEYKDGERSDRQIVNLKLGRDEFVNKYLRALCQEGHTSYEVSRHKLWPDYPRVTGEETPYDAVLLAAQYCYDFLIVFYPSIHGRFVLYPPEEYEKHDFFQYLYGKNFEMECPE
jgi:hypothetical protein